MHPKRNARRPLLWGLFLAAGVFGSATYGQPPAAGQPMPPAQPAPTEAQRDPKTGALIVPVGGLVSFDPKIKGTVTDIVVSNENVLQVRVDPADPNKLLMTGRQPGLTQLSFVVKDQPRVVFDVVVQPDLSLLRNLIKRTVPTAAVDVQPGIGNVIVLSGYVTSPQDADTVTRLAVTAAGGNQNNVINAVQVGGGQQVQIDVVVASVDRNLLRSRGFDFFFRSGDFRFQSIISGLLGGAAIGIPNLSADANLQFAVVPDRFLGALRALRSEGVAKLVAEPKIVTQTGRPGFFRSGGQQAILSSTSGITGPGVQLVPFGTELEVLPIVYGNGQIWLEVNPRITAVNQSLGITVGGALSPGFTEQQVRAAVMLESGQTFAIGGLIQNSVNASASKVPVLGEIPFLSFGFSRVQHDQRESELIILVTPRLVGPMNCDQVPKRVPGRETRNPDDYELFLESILEAPRGQRKVWNGRCYNAAWKCDPTAALFPCVGNACTGGPGGACGVGGACSAATGCCRPGAEAETPAAPGLPAALPPVPVHPGHGGSGALPPVLPAAPPPPAGGGEPAPITLPVAPPPPAVVIPEAPRN
jgi:pilus assembly protein CpaC